MTTKLPKLIILISGSGSNLQAIINAIKAGQIAAQPVLVVSNRKAAYGLDRAKDAGIPTLFFPFLPYRNANKTREQYDADLATALKPYHPDLIILAGWMRILSAAFLDEFPEKVINLHPALPSQFDGVRAIERAFTAYKKGEIDHSGCMMHWVIPKVDAGPVIVQANVPIYPHDTLESFAERMHQTEHKIIVDAIQKVLQENSQTQEETPV